MDTLVPKYFITNAFLSRRGTMEKRGTTEITENTKKSMGLCKGKTSNIMSPRTYPPAGGGDAGTPS